MPVLYVTRVRECIADLVVRRWTEQGNEHRVRVDTKTIGMLADLHHVNPQCYSNEFNRLLCRKTNQLSF